MTSVRAAAHHRGALRVDDHCGGLRPTLLDPIGGPCGAMLLRVPVLGQFDVRGSVQVFHACADGQCAAIRGHVDTERDDAPIGTRFHGAVRP